MYAPKDELQDLLARLISCAHEPGTRDIYRGEPECFPRISSGLYRQLYEIDDQDFDIGSAQQRRIELARQYAPHLSDDDILTRLQHLGGKTNLIDFTRDLNVALFFGSYYSPGEDGRVIIMEEPRVRREERQVFASYKLVSRGNPASMTDVQKSVWVEPRNGYIDEEDVTTIEIPSALKPEILLHLRVASCGSRPIAGGFGLGEALRQCRGRVVVHGHAAAAGRRQHHRTDAGRALAFGAHACPLRPRRARRAAAPSRATTAPRRGRVPGRRHTAVAEPTEICSPHPQPVAGADCKLATLPWGTPGTTRPAAP